MLRTIAFLSLSLLLPSNASAGYFDGVWVFSEIPESSYFLLNQNTDTLLVISAPPEMDGWDAFIGNISLLPTDRIPRGFGLTSSRITTRLRTLVGQDGDQADFTISFSSLTAAQVTIHSCDDCGLPLGTPIPFEKIF